MFLPRNFVRIMPKIGTFTSYKMAKNVNGGGKPYLREYNRKYRTKALCVGIGL